MTEQTGAPSGAERPLGGASFFATDRSPRGGGSTPGAAGFHLSRESLTTELKNLESLRTRISNQLGLARPMWSIVPPGQDPASVRNAAASNNSGSFYLGHLLRESAYLDSVIRQMKEALGTHETNDQQAAIGVKQAGQEPI